MLTNKEIALQYLSHGLSVIPLISPPMIKKQMTEEEFVRQCKKPCVPWKQFQTRLPTIEEVSAWFDKNPNANIGIVTGEISNLVVFDLDSKAAEDYAENEGGFPDTVKVKTGKGYHIYMRHPGFRVVNDVKKEYDLDIRGDGGYVVAPPSQHGSGNHYEWVDGFSISEIDPAPLTPWMEDYLKEFATTANNTIEDKPPKPSKNLSMDSTPATPDPYMDILINGAQQGNRNDSATKLIGHLLGKGNDENVAWEIFKQWNAVKNQPPLSDAELKNIFVSIRDQERKNGKKEPEKKVIDVAKFLDTEKRIAAEYNEQYVRIPFASGDLLSIMQSKMNGGLIGGRTYVIGGIPSAGKTVLINNMADNMCLNDHPVLFFSYDDGVIELRYRTFSRFSGFNIEEFNNRKLSESDLKAIFNNESVSSIRKSKYVVQEIIKIEDWPEIVTKIKAHHNKAPVVMIDYLRKVKTGSNRMDERLRVDEILSALTNMAKTYNLPVVVISELSRESYKTGQNLSMTSFKESGSIEYEASWLGILAAVEEDGNGFTLKKDWEHIINHDGNIDLIVFKAKRGTGTTGKIALKMDKSHMSVRDRIEATKASNVTQLKRSSKFD
jgi:KaiC/GvpD/RAD55 family RecA-like ATPase